MTNLKLRTAIDYYNLALKHFLIIKMLQQQRLSGRDCRNPEHKDVFSGRHPWQLDLGNPCRDDDFCLS